jgi:hypothetical protein
VELDNGDHEYINSKLIHKAEKYKDLKTKVLDIDLFPCGRRWYDQNWNGYVPKKPYMVHYNWVIGTGNKIMRMQRRSISAGLPPRTVSA